ncbi:MAG TPA: hypothetical protein DIW46_06460 [Microbacterium sp.]|nr:hypothetical protein [Microbacterium sp.]
MRYEKFTTTAWRPKIPSREAYAAEEAKHVGHSEFEIVFIGSDSIETIMKTLGHYLTNETEELFSQLELAHR